MGEYRDDEFAERPLSAKEIEEFDRRDAADSAAQAAAYAADPVAQARRRASEAVEADRRAAAAANGVVIDRVTEDGGPFSVVRVADGGSVAVVNFRLLAAAADVAGIVAAVAATGEVGIDLRVEEFGGEEHEG